MTTTDPLSAMIKSGRPERSVLAFFSPKELEKMARREYQNPPLRKTAGAMPTWYIRVRKRVIWPDGQPKRKQAREYLGFLKDLTERQAQRVREKKLAEINGQIYSVPSEVQLKEFYLIFNEKHLPTLGKGTQEKYRLHMQNHILPQFGMCKLCEITTEQIQGFLNDKKKLGLSWWTRNDLRNLLSCIFTKADDWGYWKERNPAERTTCGRKENKRERRILTDVQVLQLLDVLPAFLALILRILDSTGMRVSEILGLRWKNVDLEMGWLRIEERMRRGESDQPKSERSRRSVPLGDLVDELRDLKAAQAGSAQELGCDIEEMLVFHKRGGEPHDDRDLNQHYLRKAAKRLKIYWQGFGFHSFRRGQITGVQQFGASSIEAAHMAGHSRPSMTYEYTVLERRRQEELVRARQKRLQKAG